MKLVIGIRLMRKYEGEEHYVTVLAKGYEYQGKTYKSLSAIAKRITGTNWNGNLFFGLIVHGGMRNGKEKGYSLRCLCL